MRNLSEKIIPHWLRCHPRIQCAFEHRRRVCTKWYTFTGGYSYVRAYVWIYRRYECTGVCDRCLCVYKEAKNTANQIRNWDNINTHWHTPPPPPSPPSHTWLLAFIFAPWLTPSHWGTARAASRPCFQKSQLCNDFVSEDGSELTFVNFDLFCPLLRALMHLPLEMRLPVYTQVEASRERERVWERERESVCVCQRASEREMGACMYVAYTCMYVR